MRGGIEGESEARRRDVAFVEGQHERAREERQRRQEHGALEQHLAPHICGVLKNARPVDMGDRDFARAGVPMYGVRLDLIRFFSHAASYYHGAAF
eukprot:2466054-Pleurochrysis_carterae.AAC.1